MFSLVEKIETARNNVASMGLHDSLIDLVNKEPDNLLLHSICEDISKNINPDRLFSYLSKKTSSFILGNFSCPYHQEMSLECCEIHDVKPSLDIIEFEHIRCVIQKQSTEGIKSEQIVAIFPENFNNRVVTFSDPVYYFVNKFAARHLKFTKSFIQKSFLANFLDPIIRIEDKKTFQIIANWVHLHELEHRKGLMPVPEFLKEKSGKYSAAMEELRADLGVIQYCLNKQSSESILTALYVFTERLLAYPLFRSRTNFDAISSLLFWQHLDRNNFFNHPNITSLKIEVERLSYIINQAEVNALGLHTTKERRDYLNNFVLNNIGDINEQFDKYTRYWEAV